MPRRVYARPGSEGDAVLITSKVVIGETSKADRSDLAQSPEMDLAEVPAANDCANELKELRLPRFFLPGIECDSPLAGRLTDKLAGLAQVITTAGQSKERNGWRRMVAGTTLQWYGSSGPQVEPDETRAEVMIDLRGLDVGGFGRIWRVVDAAGDCVLTPFFAIGRCYRPESMVSLFLIESVDGGATWAVLGTAHLSGLQTYHRLLEGVGNAVASLIAAGIGSGLARLPWQSEGSGFSGTVARLGYHTRHSMSLLRNYLTCELWAIGVLDAKPEEVLAGIPAKVTNWIEIPERDGYVADPFSWPGRPNVILCERFTHSTGRGTLQALTMQDGRIVRTEDVSLEIETHLSYPFSWFESGSVYCLPEMGPCRRQVMYELSPDAPPRPVCVVAENIEMADPTLFQHGGLYWIAYTDGDIGLYDNLCLLWAERLEGPWQRHGGNPVKIDVRSSRGAGGLFLSGGSLIRPAQNCTRSYGGSLVLNRVLECSTIAYREEPIATLLPDLTGRFPDGLHTLSICNDKILIDGRRHIVDLNVLWQRIRRRLGKLAVRPARYLRSWSPSL